MTMEANTAEFGAEESGIQRHIGPLPIWGWGAVAGGFLLVILFMRSRGQNVTPSGDTGSSAGGDNPGNPQPIPSTDADSRYTDLSQLINQGVSGLTSQNEEIIRNLQTGQAGRSNDEIAQSIYSNLLSENAAALKNVWHPAFVFGGSYHDPGDDYDPNKAAYGAYWNIWHAGAPKQYGDN